MTVDTDAYSTPLEFSEMQQSYRANLRMNHGSCTMAWCNQAAPFTPLYRGLCVLYCLLFPMVALFSGCTRTVEADRTNSSHADGKSLCLHCPSPQGEEERGWLAVSRAPGCDVSYTPYFITVHHSARDKPLHASLCCAPC